MSSYERRYFHSPALQHQIEITRKALFEEGLLSESFAEIEKRCAQFAYNDPNYIYHSMEDFFRLAHEKMAEMEPYMIEGNINFTKLETNLHQLNNLCNGHGAKKMQWTVNEMLQQCWNKKPDGIKFFYEKLKHEDKHLRNRLGAYFKLLMSNDREYFESRPRSRM